MVLEGLLYARHRARRWRCSPDTHTPDFCLHRTYSLKRESEKTNRSQPENLGEKKENIFSSTLESAIFQGDIKLRDIIFGVTIVCMGLKAVRMRSPKNGCINLHPHQQCMKVPFTPYILASICYFLSF
ncbi:uncharacterized protein LOC119867182 isoform X11 [Canis lupus familiaris]|uniref:uncharacterized protein LOC119867182 isoform X11 n=1 Tax=Canis lupus familiaris TaxID=9615 RepID=UPI0018F599C0|nr:uncharacterized protein LOC119867182 isoform X11 [Canis lupus familiaris]